MKTVKQLEELLYLYVMVNGRKPSYNEFEEFIKLHDANQTTTNSRGSLEIKVIPKKG